MLSETHAWRAIIALDRLLAERGHQTGRFALGATEARALPAEGNGEPGAVPTDSPEVSPTDSPEVSIEAWSSPPGAPPAARSWRAPGPVDARATHLLDLYLPIVLAPPRDRPQVVAHLAQSLDGRIATAGGSSQWISGSLDQMHNHRMRALCDAVLVGAETVIHDDPQLTCREVEGPHPMRVVVDPQRRVSLERRLFQDATAPTVIFTRVTKVTPVPDHVSVVVIDEPGEGISPKAILSALAPMGVRRLFIEGGGVTISSFLRARMLDRLQLAVAPVLIGSGRTCIQLPAIDSLDHALRPRVRWFPLEPDMLVECMFDA